MPCIHIVLSCGQMKYYYVFWSSITFITYHICNYKYNMPPKKWINQYIPTLNHIFYFFRRPFRLSTGGGGATSPIRRVAELLGRRRSSNVHHSDPKYATTSNGRVASNFLAPPPPMYQQPLQPPQHSQMVSRVAMDSVNRNPEEMDLKAKRTRY